MSAVVVACIGGGVDSTAMVIEMVRRGRAPALAMFSDTGSEKPETYATNEIFFAWLRAHGVEVVIPRKIYAKYSSLEEQQRARRDLPSRAYGFGTCAWDWKLVPMWNELARRFGKERPTRAIGFGLDDAHRATREIDQKGYPLIYPLIEFGLDRDAEVAIIEAAGLPVPMKSACWFCPSSKPDEIVWLSKKHPDLAARALELEDLARNRHLFTNQRGDQYKRSDVVGLGRRFSWRDYIEADEAARAEMPPAIVEECGVCVDGGAD